MRVVEAGEVIVQLSLREQADPQQLFSQLLEVGAKQSRSGGPALPHSHPSLRANVDQATGVGALKDAIAAADGLLLASPEYNNSMPGVMKNAVDWLTRPATDIPRVFGGKPVALIGASPGGFGTILAQNAWLPVFRTLGAQFWAEGRLLVSRAHTVFAADGSLVDAKVRESLRTFLESYVRFVEENVSPPPVRQARERQPAK